jgi:hypothetical protein
LRIEFVDHFSHHLHFPYIRVWGQLVADAQDEVGRKRLQDFLGIFPHVLVAILGEEDEGWDAVEEHLATVDVPRARIHSERFDVV